MMRLTFFLLLFIWTDANPVSPDLAAYTDEMEVCGAYVDGLEYDGAQPHLWRVEFSGPCLSREGKPPWYRMACFLEWPLQINLAKGSCKPKVFEPISEDPLPAPRTEFNDPCAKADEERGQK